MTSAQMVGYWCGYRDNGTSTPLNQTLKEASTVALAFAGILADSTLSTNYLCTNFSAGQIQSWSKQLQSQGQKVTLSLIDNPNVHWNNIDLEKFAKSAKEVALDQWNLDGFDIDVEGPAIATLAEFIPLLRKEIGETPLITFTGYTGSGEELEVLKAVQDSISWVQTMAYDLPLENMKKLAAIYAAIVGKERVTIGIKVGTTSTHECRELAKWAKKEGYGGVMVWSFDMDNPTFTQKPQWHWSNAILKGFNEKSYLEILSDAIVPIFQAAST